MSQAVTSSYLQGIRWRHLLSTRMAPTSIFLVVGTCIFFVQRLVRLRLWSPLARLQGPPLNIKLPLHQCSDDEPADSIFLGHQGRLLTQGMNSFEVLANWGKSYGPSYAFRGILQVRAIRSGLDYEIFHMCLNFKRPSLYTVDPRAISHVLHRPETYAKPTLVLRFLQAIFGKGKACESFDVALD